MFSDLVKSLRIEMRLTLRQFCLQTQLDPSNWSKVERGVNPPPGDARLLENLAQFFKLDEAKKQEFLDAAAVARRELPADLVEDELFLRALPAFFRAARGHELSDAALAEFAEDIRKLHRADAPLHAI